MRKLIWAVALAACCMVGGQVMAQVQSSPPDFMKPPADAPPPRTVAAGPYAVEVVSDPSLPTHTIYRPVDLAGFSDGRLPIVAWGNGGCANVGLAFEGFLRSVASHGYLVVAIGPKDAKMPAFTPPQPGKPFTPPPAASKASQLIDAIDWAVAQNARTGGPYAGKLDVKAVALAGQSCGGLQTIKASADPRVATSLIFNSGVLPSGSHMPAISDATKADLAAFHAPVAYFIGGPSDIAFKNAEDDFSRIQTPVFKGNLKVGHMGTFYQPNGGWFAEVAVAWLDWRLKGDAKAERLFSGPACGLCVDPAWSVEKKAMP
jgi:dienelactone hydrolase